MMAALTPDITTLQLLAQYIQMHSRVTVNSLLNCSFIILARQ